MEAILVQNDNTNRRMQYLEYKSIDMESPSRRNNLIFRGLPEENNIENMVVDPPPPPHPPPPPLND